MKALLALVHLRIANRYYRKAADCRRRGRDHERWAKNLGYERPTVTPGRWR